jgi:hypothetical protein
MITIPQNVMRLGMIASFAVGGIVTERLAIFTYKLAVPAIKRLYDKMATSSRPFSVTPRRKRPTIVRTHGPVNGPTNGNHGKKPKVVPTAAAE